MVRNALSEVSSVKRIIKLRVLLGCVMRYGARYEYLPPIRKRDDIDAPSSVNEAVSMVHQLLEQGSFLEVLAVEPEERPTNTVQWG